MIRTTHEPCCELDTLANEIDEASELEACLIESQEDPRSYLPSSAEIAAACAEIRAEWPAWIHRKRWTGSPSRVTVPRATFRGSR